MEAVTFLQISVNLYKLHGVTATQTATCNKELTCAKDKHEMSQQQPS
jgi:hypothetical protein